MKMNLVFRLVVIFILLVLLGFLCSEYRENSSLKRQVRELGVQLAQSTQKADTFIIRDSIHVWKQKIVEVDKTDYKKELADKELISDLKLRVSQLESENRMLLSTRDSVIMSLSDDSCYTYKDKWCNFSFEPKSGELDYEVRDSVCAYVAREYKHRFLWFRWGTKGYDVFIVNYNPKCRVEYNKYIRIK